VIGNAHAEEFKHRLGKNIARCREKAELSQEGLGLRASLHRTEISQAERGLRVLRTDTLVKIAGALGVPASELLDGLVWEPGEYTPGGFQLRPSAEASQ
jgi:transcriptional regulator with XRE-family HTH domain